jgi:hypothetical protein
MIKRQTVRRPGQKPEQRMPVCGCIEIGSTAIQNLSTLAPALFSSPCGGALFVSIKGKPMSLDGTKQTFDLIGSMSASDPTWR